MTSALASAACSGGTRNGKPWWDMMIVEMPTTAQVAIAPTGMLTRQLRRSRGVSETDTERSEHWYDGHGNVNHGRPMTIEHDDRPVPEVQRIRDQAEPDKRTA